MPAAEPSLEQQLVTRSASIFSTGWEEGALDAAADAALWKTALACGLQGVVRVDGAGLPPVPKLARGVQIALGRGLATCDGIETQPRVAIRPGGARLMPTPADGKPPTGNCFRFAMEPGSELDTVLVLSWLTAESEQNGTATILPELVNFLEEVAPSCSWCRLQIHLIKAEPVRHDG